MLFFYILSVLLHAAITLLVLFILISVVSSIIDRSRHNQKPAKLYEMGDARYGVSLAHLPERTSPSISGSRRKDGKKLEKVARLCQVAPLMRRGDPGTHSGRAFHAYLIRIPTWSAMSHAYMVDVENEGTAEAVPYIIDTTFKLGVSRRLLADEVAKYPGQYYWSPMTGEASRHYHREHAIEAAMDMVRHRTKYGWGAIVFQTLIRLPITRELAYATNLAAWWPLNKLPFCSGGLAIWMRSGGTDICKGRSPELIVPQDVEQCPLMEEWVALLP